MKCAFHATVIQCSLCVALWATAAVGAESANTGPTVESTASGAAQTQGAANSPGEKDGANTGLAEVVVTATRRETSLERTPISMSVLSAGAITENRVLDLTDVTRLTPSLVYVPRGDSEGYISLRGAIIFDDSPGTDPAVSLFVDDVVRVSVADVSPQLFDMDRVEVLKGPQGTLFGRNSIGGVASMYTKQPTFETEGSTEVTYGDHGLVQGTAVFNTPILNDKLAARVAVAGSSVRGNVKDVVTGGELNGNHWAAARAKLLFTPRDDFKLVTGFDFLHREGSNSTWISGNFEPMLLPNLTYDPEKSNQLTPGMDYQQNWGFLGRADWTTGVGTVTSITGYRHLDGATLTAAAPAPINIANIGTREHDTQVTQELRLASPADTRLTWILGAYFLHSNRARSIDAFIDYLPASLLGFLAGFPAPITNDLIQATGTTSAAPFAHLTYSLTDRLKVEVGGRYTWQRKSGHGFSTHANLFAGGPIGAVYSASWTAFTPAMTVTFQPTQSLMTYATASKGFLSGGFNAQGSTAATLGTPFDSEYVWNYEVGAKFDGLSNRLRVNVAGFVDRYSNLQVIQFNTQLGAADTTNAGAASVDGIETEISALPVRWLTVGVAYDYLHSKFTEYLVKNGDGTVSNYAGNQVPFTPKHRVTASAEVHTDLPQGAGSLAVGGDYTYRSSQEFTVANDIPPDIRKLTEWRGIVNAHASWHSEKDRWEVSLWGKNIANRHYAVFAQDQTFAYATPAELANPLAHIFEIQAGPYRSYGMTVRINF
jgi:iron complex outermembrane receptor protein